MKTLFDRSQVIMNHPATHHNDPVTSFDAAERVKQSGVLKNQCRAVLAVLKRMPSSTSAELADYMEISRHIPARRLPDLEKMGKVEKGPIRKCKITKSNCVTWRAVKKLPLFE